MRRFGLLVFGLFLLTACGRGEESERPSAPATPPESTVAPKSTEVTAPEVTAKLVEVDLSVFKFTPKQIVLKVGEPVQFKTTSKDTIHSFTVKDLGIDVELTPGGQKISEVFTPPADRNVPDHMPAPLGQRLRDGGLFGRHGNGRAASLSSNPIASHRKTGKIGQRLRE